MKTEFYSSAKRNLSTYFIPIYSAFFLCFFIVIKLKNPEELIVLDFITALTLISCLFYPIYPSKLQKIIPIFLLLFFNPLLDNVVSTLPFILKTTIYTVFFIFLIKSQLIAKSKYILLFNLVFLCIVYSFNYLNTNKMVIRENRNIIELTAISEIKKQHNVDILIIDAYPDFQLLKDSFAYTSKLKEKLNENSFIIENSHVTSTRTPYSVANLIYGKNLNDSFVLDYNSRKIYLNQIIQKSKLLNTAKNNHYLCQNNTLLNYQFDNTIWKSYWPDFDYSHLGLLNKLPILIERCKHIYNVGITKDLYPNTLSSNYEAIDNYNIKVQKAANKPVESNNKYLNVYHLLTLHKYNSENPRDAFDNDIKEADKIGCDMINILLKNHNSTIIVCSDHGNRTVLKNAEYQKKGILAIKKLP